MITPSKRIGFRIPLKIIADSIHNLGDFPVTPGEVSWDGPTLFIKGKHADYINEENLPLCRKFFPNMRLETLDAGHWVQADRPVEFVDVVERFVKSV
jgi:pimeloyl-ACP methyl ester carboxylesterase